MRALARRRRAWSAGAGVDLADDLERHLLLQVLGGEDEEALVVGERVADRREERGGGLSEAGRGLEQEVLAVVEGVLDRGDDLLLARAEVGVRKADTHRRALAVARRLALAPEARAAGRSGAGGRRARGSRSRP